MWVSPTQTRLLGLINEYEFHTSAQFDKGKAISQLNGKRTYPQGGDTGSDPAGQKEYDRLIRELNQLSEQVPLDAPWTMPRAEHLDTLTVEQWLGSRTRNRDVISFLQLALRTLFTTNPHHMSLLYCLFYLRTGDNFETLIGLDEKSAQAFRVKETMHQVAVRLSKDVDQSLVLEAPVSEISQDETGVTVKSIKGDWRAKYAIVAVPLPLSARINYSPSLPPERDIPVQHMPDGLGYQVPGGL